MDLCARNVSRVHAFSSVPALSQPEYFGEMNDKRRILPVLCRDADEQELICPKPRHVVFGMDSETFEASGRPVPRLRGTAFLPTEAEVGHEIMDILLKVNTMELSNSGNVSAHMVMSPPCRAGNPMIRDLHFFQKRAMTSPTDAPHVSSSSRGTGSAVKTLNVSCKSAPLVRVEGFMSECH